MASKNNDRQWDAVIRPRSGWFDIDLRELAHYRDLILLLVKRNVTVLYKQTVLGPAWMVISAWSAACRCSRWPMIGQDIAALP